MYILLPAALVFAAAAVVVFAWATRSGQFDDLETPALRILGDDDPLPPRGRAAKPPGARDKPDREPPA